MGKTLSLLTCWQLVPSAEGVRDIARLAGRDPRTQVVCACLPLLSSVALDEPQPQDVRPSVTRRRCVKVRRLATHKQCPGESTRTLAQAVKCQSCGTSWVNFRLARSSTSVKAGNSNAEELDGETDTGLLEAAPSVPPLSPCSLVHDSACHESDMEGLEGHPDPRAYTIFIFICNFKKCLSSSLKK